MTNYEESAKTFESDYRFAPVGMAVLTFWVGALLSGLVAFFLSCFTAKGLFGNITDASGHFLNSRTYVQDPVHGLYDGVAVTIVLLILSLFIGLVGKAAVNKKAALGGLWKLSVLFALAAPVITIGLVVAYH